MPSYAERYAEWAKRLAPGVGGETLVEVSPELQLSVVYEMDRPEQQILGGTRLWHARIAVAAGGAGNASSVAIGLPGSNIESPMLSVLTHIQSSKTVIMGLVSGLAGFAAANGNRGFRDSRAKGGPATGFFTKNSAASLLGSVGQSLVAPANQVIAVPPFVITFPAVLPNLLIEDLTLNDPIDLSLWGYERSADKHEVDATVI